MNMIRNLNIILIFSLITGCSLAPGMHLDTEKAGLMKSSMYTLNQLEKQLKLNQLIRFQIKTRSVTKYTELVLEI